MVIFFLGVIFKDYGCKSGCWYGGRRVCGERGIYRDKDNRRDVFVDRN